MAAAGDCDRGEDLNVWLGWIGFGVWLFGFAVEVVADAQKSSLRMILSTAGIHPPDLLGLATPLLEKLLGLRGHHGDPFLRAGYATLISPVFVSFLR